MMAAKKLKAIVVRGTESVKLADPQGFRELARSINKLNAAKEAVERPEVEQSVVLRRLRPTLKPSSPIGLTHS